MSDRTNFANFEQLQSACDCARTVLRRKGATIDEVRQAAQELNKAVRTLRSWHDSRSSELRDLRGGRRKWFITTLACILLAGSSWASLPPTFQVKETELTSYERHNDKLIYPTQPLYRLGEIMKVTTTGQWVVPVNRSWFINHWVYSVVEVRVSKKGK